MPVSIQQEAIEGVVVEGALLRQVATGFTFTEGPIWDPNGNWLLFSDIAESKQYHWDEQAGLRIFRQPSNQANGNCFDRQGRIISCEHASSHLVIHDHGGKRVTVLASHYEGLELNSPNDVICDSRGRIWFSDPAFGRLREDLGLIRDQELSYQGVFRLDPDGTLTCVINDLQQPNGLCLSNDEKQLYVNDSWGPTIHIYDVGADGDLSDGRLWATVTGQGEGVPDGMKVDLSDRVFCNGPGGVHVFDHKANHLGVIRTPEKSTNFCFGGPDHAILFITACTSVYAIDTNTNSKPAY
ncbi:MAG: SMP-30/gluconolactonase/LRE family protein [Pseudomonadota bacterium]